MVFHLSRSDYKCRLLTEIFLNSIFSQGLDRILKNSRLLNNSPFFVSRAKFDSQQKTEQENSDIKC